MYATAIPAANAILKIAFENHVRLTPMHLQRLLYLMYNGYIRQTGKPLFDEPFYVYAYGPVAMSVHSKFKCLKSKPIRTYATDAKGGIEILDVSSNKVLRHVMADIEAVYMRRPPHYLCGLVRRPGTAWYAAYQADRETLDDKNIERDPSFEI